jgi:hypothetical protein
VSPDFQEIHVKLKKLAEATMWLPGFVPDDSLQVVPCFTQTAEIIAFPSVDLVQVSVPVNEDDAPDLSVSVPTVIHASKPPRILWPSLDPVLHSKLRGDVAKFDANLAAVSLLHRLEADSRPPTDDERDVLNCYTGWGGIPKAFNPDQDESAWKARAESMPEILGEDYESAKGSVVNAHFTEVFVIEAIWDAVRRMGFLGGRVLEPSAGVGYFIGAMPKDMVERIIYCEMGVMQRHVYVTTLGAFRKMLSSGIAARVSSIALEALLRLRQCCSFPLLLPKALNPQQVPDSSKLDATFRIVDEDIMNGRKTIIFSQFRMVSDAIEKGLTERGIGVARLDGDSVDRETPVKRFQSDPGVRVFVVGFRAGGFGLNLTAAESVILFDPWWNPAAESQAYARAHRIGQKKKVFVSKLICSDTVEDKMLQLAANKSAIANSFAAMPDKMTTADLIELLG